jgi:acetyl-CoA decarbonylase/synthase complex subunit gamma
MDYLVEPGLYALGCPDRDSPVLVTANYKMSFDRLRSRLGGRSAWILVLNTHGINVWCAAGKGTFGTEELIGRIKTHRIADIVSHRRIILPQLGAPGVAAHRVRKNTGFWIVYGPVRAEDLPRFLDSGLKATPRMRRITFPFKDRIVLAPVETVMALKPAGIVFSILLFLGGIGKDIFSYSRMMSHAPYALTIVLSALFSGAVLTPALLPWIPGRPFALKGALAGIAGAVLLNYRFGISLLSARGFGGIFLLATFSSFLAMNFTGASTYTSLSGVRKEMKFAVPAQIFTLLAGLGFLTKGYWI